MTDKREQCKRIIRKLNERYGFGLDAVHPLTTRQYVEMVEKVLAIYARLENWTS